MESWGRFIFDLPNIYYYPLGGITFFLYPVSFEPILGPIQRALQWVLDLLAGVKRLGREAIHWFPSQLPPSMPSWRDQFKPYVIYTCSAQKTFPL